MRRFLFLFSVFALAFCSIGYSAKAQQQAPATDQTALPDVPISHLTVSATFTGFNAQGPGCVHAIGSSGSAYLNCGSKMFPASIDTAGTELTEYVGVAYEHISVPDLSARYELVLVDYHNTFPRIKALLFDSSNFVYDISAGAGKYLSPHGNHWAETVAASLTYPIAKNLGWQVISYQYIHAPASGILNANYQTMSTGPILYLFTSKKGQ